MGSLSDKKFMNYESLKIASRSVKFIYNTCKTNCKAVSVLRLTKKLLDEKKNNFKLAYFKL